MKIIYINSLPRSGSTFVQMLLANHPKVVGLGELGRAVKVFSETGGVDFVQLTKQELGTLRPEAAYCTCGQLHEECRFWGPLLPQLIDANAKEAHCRVLDRFRSVYPGRTLVDSSKSTESLLRYTPEILGSSELRVLFLVRDFRGWVPSVQKRNHIRQKLARRAGWRYGYLQDCYRWWHANRKALRCLQALGVPHLIVSYEELVFDSERQVERVGEFLDINLLKTAESAPQPEVHELYGNAGVKASSRRRKGIVYDHMWLSDRRPIAAAPLLLPVYRFNRRIQLAAVSARGGGRPFEIEAA